MFPIAITYWIWLPLEIIFYIAVAYFSKKNNDLKNKKFFITVVLLGCIPLWAFIAPDSKHLVFDGLLYDLIMVSVMTFTLILLGDESKRINFCNWLGIILVIIGLIVIKL